MSRLLPTPTASSIALDSDTEMLAETAVALVSDDKVEIRWHDPIAQFAREIYVCKGRGYGDRYSLYTCV